MTATEPQPLADLIAPWMAEARLRTAVFCAETHPFDDATLCRRLDGHSGPHAAGEDDVWDDHGDCPICTTPPEMAFDLPWPAARWSPNAPADVTDPANPGTEHHP